MVNWLKIILFMYICELETYMPIQYFLTEKNLIYFFLIIINDLKQ